MKPRRFWVDILTILVLLLPPAALGQAQQVEALHELVHAGRIAEMEAAVESVELDDPLWKKLIEVLLEAAEKKNDHTYFYSKAKAVLQQSRDAAVRSGVTFALGNAYWRTERLDDAQAAFERVMEAPGSDLADLAGGNIYELTHLKIGQPAPAVEARSMDGDLISLAGLRGKVVLLNFWASW